jgi:hypothetical protein
MQGPKGRPLNVSPARKGKGNRSRTGSERRRRGNRPFLQQPPIPSATAHSFSNRPFLQQSPFPSAIALSFCNRSFLLQSLFPPATALSLQLPSPFCHPERSRGICSSADLSWKCFSTALARHLSTDSVCLRLQENPVLISLAVTFLQSDLNYLTVWLMTSPIFLSELLPPPPAGCSD